MYELGTLNILPTMGLEGFGPFWDLVAFGLGLGFGLIKGKDKLAFLP